MLWHMSGSTFLTKHSERPILVDAREAARLLAICPRTLWQLTKDQQIPSLRIGKCVRYRVADLDAWTRSQQLQSSKHKERNDG